MCAYVIERLRSKPCRAATSRKTGDLSAAATMARINRDRGGAVVGSGPTGIRSHETRGAKWGTGGVSGDK